MIKLELYKECYRCYGTGAKDQVKCCDCNGAGQVLNELGEILFEFIGHHFNMSEVGTRQAPTSDKAKNYQ